MTGIIINNYKYVLHLVATSKCVEAMADDLTSRSLAVTIVEVSSLMILNVLSLLGNTLVCILFYKNARLRTTTNLYIIALAVSDLLSAIFVMPFGIGVLISGEWIFGGTMCEIGAFFVCFVAYVSPATMSLTAINRYFRICQSDQQYRKYFSPWKSRIWLACVWIFVACYAVIPKLAGLQDYAFVPGYGICALAFLSETGKIINYCIVLGLLLAFPLTAAIVSYIKVAKMIRQHNEEVSTKIPKESQRKARISAREIKLSKSLFVVVFAFMMCWAPFWVIIVFKRFRVGSGMPRNIQLFCLFLLYLSNTINPFIYAGMNPVFRKEFRKVVLCYFNHRMTLRKRKSQQCQNSCATSIDFSGTPMGTKSCGSQEGKQLPKTTTKG